MLPDIIFTKVMLKIVLESFESLHRCRQVCKSWNLRIMSNIWENSKNKEIIKIRVVEIIWGSAHIFPSDKELSHVKWLGRRILKKLTEIFNVLFGIEARGVLQPDMLMLIEKVEGWFCKEAFPSLQEITCAASLAHHGLVSSVSTLRLRDVNLSSIPEEHLATLVSYVTWSLEINNKNVSGCDLVSLWPNLRCKWVD